MWFCETFLIADGRSSESPDKSDLVIRVWDTVWLYSEGLRRQREGVGDRRKGLTLQGTEPSHLLRHQQPQLVAAVGFCNLLAAVLGLSAGQGWDGLLARDVTLGGLVRLGFGGPTTASLSHRAVSWEILPLTTVTCGFFPRRQRLVGALPQDWLPLTFVLGIQLPLQSLFMPARGLLGQLWLVLLLLGPGGEVAIVHILKVLGDRVLIVAVGPHFFFGPVREVAILGN